MASESETMLRDVREMKAALEKMASTPARGGLSPKDVFGGGGRGTGYTQDWRSDDWSAVERLKNIGGAYASEELAHAITHGAPGRRHVMGMGPTLVKMAAMAGGEVGRDAKNLALGNGWMPSDYNEDKFEAEYGMTSLVRAKSHGVPGWDRGSRKVLLNERRKTALAEGAGQTGGYVVPPQFMSELLTIMAEDAFIEPRCKVLPMNTRTADWPMLDITTAQSTGTSPYFGGMLFSWQPEAALINETEPAFKSSQWVAWDLVGYLLASNQLLADNGIGLDALLTQLMGQGVTWYKEFAFLQGLGAGSSMPLGIVNAPATILQTRSTPGRFKYADACAMFAHLQIRSWDQACWVMHQSVMPELAQMVDNANSNRLVWVSPLGDAKSMGPAAMKMPMAFLNGLPLYFTEKLPSIGNKGDVLLCDFSRYVVGNRLDYQIDVSPHYKFQNNQLAWRIVARADGKPWLNKYITDANGWQISPFIALN